MLDIFAVRRYGHLNNEKTTGNEASMMTMREAAKAAEAARTDELRRENRGFVQVYPQGWARLRSLIADNPPAARVYSILAEHIDPSAGAVVVSQAVLAEMTQSSERTVRRHTQYLEERGALVRIRVSGSVYAYCLNPAEVWRAWDSQKDMAAFVTRTLVKKGDQDALVKRRLQMMVREQEAGESLPPISTDEADFDPETGEVREG
jgi:Fe2+ or Zn2+ uptake regulation protein